ncbi:serine hydrolase [Alteriqipengyuania flavescens]|uniref:serine hydrolase n=1 Tax=Alteriqipengyuania flavescens TaxID=3053610 RepID=UPI0025B5E11C|nr:serine hydrolase [Alteriqipengyuania flavescens]WJY18098.1 serine hydrolase [Alteriqipengyuania flavescens]WJY24039.1 serine hydrolase [Alteriqipengyuania flavescens]
MKIPARFIVLLFAVLAIAVIVVSLPDHSGFPVTEKREGREEPAPPAEPSPAELALQAELTRLGGGFPGDAGLAVQEVATGKTFAHDGRGIYPQQSVSKLWVAIAALHEVDEGRLELAEMVTLRRDDLTVFHQPIRNIVNARGAFATDYADLIERALTQSDNTANDRILRRVGGPEAVQAFIDRAELAGIRFGTDERTKQSAIAGLTWRQSYSYRDWFFKARDALPDDQRRQAFEAYLAEPIDGATPLGLADALARFARGDLLSEPSTRLLLATLERTKSGPNRLKAGAPAGWSVAHKTGTGQVFDGEHTGYNDVAILTAPDGRQYAVVAMIRRTRASYVARMEMMQALSRAVGQYHDAAYGGAAEP